MSFSLDSSSGVGIECWCGREAKLLTSRTQDNPGRPFFRCVRRQGDEKAAKGESHMFKWVEDVLVEEMVKSRSELEEVKKVIEDLNDRVEASECRIRKHEVIGKVGICVISIIVGYLVFASV